MAVDAVSASGRWEGGGRGGQAVGGGEGGRELLFCHRGPDGRDPETSDPEARKDAVPAPRLQDRRSDRKCGDGPRCWMRERKRER